MAGNMTNKAGQNIPFTHENRRFHTNIDHKKGFAHAALGAAKGSVFDAPLYQDASLSLWLEHVCDKLEPNRDGTIYWLIWYDAKGWSKIPAPPVMERDDIAMLVTKLTSFLP